MTERELRNALRRAAPEDAHARERAWQVVRAAYASQPRRSRRAPWALAAVVAAVLAAGGAGVAAAAAPDSGVGGWVRDVLGVGTRAAAPAGEPLPGGGRLLVQAGDTAWLVSSDGTRRRLGTYAGASWSPHGRFILAWRDGRLSAIEGDGDVRWSLTRPQDIAVARWGPVDGFRVAYVAGAELRIVDGDGTGDRALASALTGVAPAWRPGSGRLLAFVDEDGLLQLVQVDAHRLVWRRPVPGRPVALAWSPGGGRLLVTTARRLLVLDAAGRRIASRPLAAAQDPVWSPDGRRVAVVRRSAATGQGEVVLLDAAHELRPSVLFSGPGGFGTPAWSPDGRRLLVPWPAADQWLYLRPDGGAQLTTVSRIADRFTPGAAGPRFAGTLAWCCSRR